MVSSSQSYGNGRRGDACGDERRLKSVGGRYLPGVDVGRHGFVEVLHQCTGQEARSRVGRGEASHDRDEIARRAARHPRAGIGLGAAAPDGRAVLVSAGQLLNNFYNRISLEK